MPYHVFISHAHANKSDARWIAKELKAFNYNVWIDNLEISPGEDWPDEIEKGIDDCAVLVVIWTKDAKNSKWVKNEITRADEKSKPIIPLLYDDTELSIVLQTKQFIDFKNSVYKGFQLLVSELNRYLEDLSHLESQTNSIPYQRVARPFMRNRFLDENNYLNPKNENFALSERAIPIADKQFKLTQRFVSLVAVPIPDELPIEKMDELRELLDQPNPNAPGIGTSDSSTPWSWFSLAYLRGKYRTNTEYWLYEEPPNSESLKTRKYIRFLEGGAIEYVISDNSVLRASDDVIKPTVYNLIYILGSAWKFVSLVSYICNKLSYNGKLQFLVNLTETRDSWIGIFADPVNQNQPRWSEPFRYNDVETYKSDFDEFRCLDKNIQFVYDINLSDFLQNPTLIEQLVVDLSWRLQRSYNYEPEDRQYSIGTRKFPWRQYDHFTSRY